MRTFFVAASASDTSSGVTCPLGEYDATAMESSPMPLLVAAIDRSRKGCSLSKGLGSTSYLCTSAGIQELMEIQRTSPAAGRPRTRAAGRFEIRFQVNGATMQTRAKTAADAAMKARPGDRTCTST